MEKKLFKLYCFFTKMIFENFDSTINFTGKKIDKINKSLHLTRPANCVKDCYFL